MAKQPYPTQGPPPTQPPPPYYAYQPASGPPPQNVNVVHVPQQQPKKGGMFSSFLKEVDKVGKQIGKEIDYASNKVNEAVDKNWSSSLLDMFRSGNVVQLIARSSGRTVQIALGSAGQLVLDANGPLDPNAFNTLWTVISLGNNQVQLQNYNNYLAVVDGQTLVISSPPSTVPGPETKFQLSQLQGQFVTLESLREKHRHVGFTKAGELKHALATGKEMDAQFGVKLVSTAYPTVQPTAQGHK